MKRQTTGVYLLKEDKILFLVRQKKNDTLHKKGIYLPIGGHVDLGESIDDGAVREVFEESGIKVISVDLRGIVYIHGQAAGGSDNIIFLFTSSEFQGDPIPGDEGYFEWVDKNNLEKINLYPGDKIFLNYLFTTQFFVLDFTYKGFKLIDYKILKVIK